MNIETNYLVMYYNKKGDQKLLVLPYSELVEWQIKNRKKEYKTFLLTQTQVSTIRMNDK